MRTHASIVWRHAGIGEFGEYTRITPLKTFENWLFTAAINTCKDKQASFALIDIVISDVDKDYNSMVVRVINLWLHCSADDDLLSTIDRLINGVSLAHSSHAPSGE